MTALKANGASVLAGAISMPVTGAWHARLVLDADSADSFDGASITVESEDGKVELHGTAYRSGDDFGRVEVWMVGGAGGLGAALDDRYYVGVPARIVLTDLLREAGEALADSSDNGVLSRTLDTWTRASGAAGRLLAEVADELGAAWRVLDDGSVWVGQETWPEASVEHEEIATSPADGRMIIADDALATRPGTTFAGRRVANVQHTIEVAALRTEVWFASDDESGAEGPGGLDRIKGVIGRFIALVMRRVDYHALYPAKVVKQASDGTLEVQIDDARFPSLTKVPIRTFAPDVVITVEANARVLLGFEGGSPAHPYASLWQSGAIVSVAIGGDADATSRASITDDRLDALEQAHNDFVTVFNAHTHVAPMGGTTPPASPGQSIQPGESTASEIVLIGG